MRHATTWRAITGVFAWSAVCVAQPGGGRMPISAPPIEPPGALANGPKGSLAVRAVQGTKGGPEVGKATVELELIHDNQTIETLTTELNDQGLVLIGDLPVGVSVRPLVRIKYANVMYQDIGPVMDTSTPSASMDVTVYETTEETPAWRVSMRHVMIQPVVAGVNVSETVVVENPADKTWIGGTPGSDGRRPVVVVSLPKGAKDVQLDEGFHGWCCTALVGSTLTVQMPLMPGSASYRYSYRLPAADLTAEVTVASPAECDHLMMFVPADGSKVDMKKVEPVEAPAMQAQGMRVYQADRVGAGTPVGVVVSNLIAAAPASGGGMGLSGSTIGIAVSVGAVVLVLGGIALKRFKGGSSLG